MSKRNPIGKEYLALGAFALVAAYFLFKKEEPPHPESVKIIDCQLMVNDQLVYGETDVAPGFKIGATVSWENTGTSPCTATLRLDLKRDKVGATWQEGNWVTSPRVQPGQRASVVVFRYIPADWGPGQRIIVKLMLKGLEGSIREWNTLRIPAPNPEKWVNIKGAQLTGGYYDENQGILYVPKRGTISILVTWQNCGSVSYAATFRLDAKKGGWPETWREGEDAKSVNVAPNGETTTKASVSIPGDWGVGEKLSFKLMIIGKEEPWRTWPNLGVIT